MRALVVEHAAHEGPGLVGADEQPGAVVQQGQVTDQRDRGAAAARLVGQGRAARG